MKQLASAYDHWNDIVFEHRNKGYGAYQLRKLYASHILKAFLLTVVVFAGIISLPELLDFLSKEEKALELPGKIIHYTELAPPPPIEQTPPPKVNTPPPVKKVVKYLPPKVTEEEVPEEEPMPTIEEIKLNDTGLENVEGTGEVVLDVPIEGTGETALPAEEAIYQFVEQMPEYEGGMEAMIKFLQKHMKYPARARRMGIEGTVYVKFVIGKEGRIEDVAILKGISKDCDEEAMRVIQMMPPWKPGKQNNNAVKVSMMLPIKFQLAET